MAMLDGSINGLMEAINESLFLPAIQRDFVWPDDRVCMLFDSILRNYPIGAISVWYTREDFQHRDFLSGDLSRDEVPAYVFRDTPKHRPYALVLDGQQRLQVLYLSFNGLVDGRRLHFNILSNPGLAEDDIHYQFEFILQGSLAEKNTQALASLTNGKDECFWLPVNALQFIGKARSMTTGWIDQYPALAPYRKRIEKNLATFRDALKRRNYLHIIELDEAVARGGAATIGMSDVLEIFVRINTQQTRLSRGDLIFSVLRLHWEGAAMSVNDFLRVVNKRHHLDIDSDFIIRCLFVVSGFGARLDIERIKTPRHLKKLQENFSGCCAAIKSVIDFINGKVFAAGPQYVGGINSLVPFVYFAFKCSGHKLPLSGRKELTKAMYLFAQLRTVSRYVDSRVTKYVREVLQEVDYEQKRVAFPYRETAAWVGKIEGVEEIDTWFLQRNYRMALAVIQNSDPKEPLDGDNKLELDHIFPRALLDAQEVDYEIRESIGNYWLLPRTLNRNKGKNSPKEFLLARKKEKKVTQVQLNAACIGNPAKIRANGHNNFIRDRERKLIRKYRTSTGISDADFDHSDLAEEAAE